MTLTSPKPVHRAPLNRYLAGTLYKCSATLHYSPLASHLTTTYFLDHP